MPDAVIVGGIRTPFAKAAGKFNYLPAHELGRMVVRELLERTNVLPEEVDELVAGNVASPVEAANCARVIALRSGIPQDRIAHTVSRNCASGMESLTEAIDCVQSGRASCVVAVGVDSMSNIPVFWNKSLAMKLWNYTKAKGWFRKMSAALAFRPADFTPQVGIKLGLTDPVIGMMMGDTAEVLAREYNIAREEQDAFALRSHQKAAAASEAGRLASEVMTVYPDKSEPVSEDDGIRFNQSAAALAKLKPYFDRRWGTITIGNACQVTDGACALLVTSAEKADELGLQPWGRVKSYAYAGCDPRKMGIGPVHATAKALEKTDLQLGDIDLVELNEAFAAQAIACLKGFETPPQDCPAPTERLGKVDEEKVNVNGGAIALGHPVGATGARIVLTLLHELTRRDQKHGLATLCIGGGQGGAVIVERLGKAA